MGRGVGHPLFCCCRWWLALLPLRHAWRRREGRGQGFAVGRQTPWLGITLEEVMIARSNLRSILLWLCVCRCVAHSERKQQSTPGLDRREGATRDTGACSNGYTGMVAADEQSLALRSIPRYWEQRTRARRCMWSGPKKGPRAPRLRRVVRRVFFGLEGVGLGIGK